MDTQSIWDIIGMFFSSGTIESYLAIATMVIGAVSAILKGLELMAIGYQKYIAPMTPSLKDDNIVVKVISYVKKGLSIIGKIGHFIALSPFKKTEEKKK